MENKNPINQDRRIARNLEELTNAFMDPTEGSRIIVADFSIVQYFDSDKHYIFGLKTIYSDAGNMIFNLTGREKRDPCSAFRIPHYSVDSEISLGKNVKLFESYEEQKQIDKKYAFNFLVPNTQTVERIKDYQHFCFDKEKRELEVSASNYRDSFTFYETNSREFQDILKAELKLREKELESKKERVQDYMSIINRINPSK